MGRIRVIMVDHVSKKTRSEIMKKIKGKNTSPELIFRKTLWKSGVRGWRLHSKNVIGKPDIVFNKIKLAVFVDGCFWHGCLSCYRRPNSRQKYWDEKLRKNVERDKSNTKELIKTGWTVIRIWEHEIGKSPTKSTDKVINALGTFDG